MKLTYDHERIFELLTVPMINLEDAYKLKQMKRPSDGEQWKTEDDEDSSKIILTRGLVTSPINLPSPLVFAHSKFIRVGDRLNARTTVFSQLLGGGAISQGMREEYGTQFIPLNPLGEGYLINSQGNAIMAIDAGKTEKENLYGYELIIGSNGTVPLYLPDSLDEFEVLISPLEKGINIVVNSLLKAAGESNLNLELLVFPD